MALSGGARGSIAAQRRGGKRRGRGRAACAAAGAAAEVAKAWEEHRSLPGGEGASVTLRRVAPSGGGVVARFEASGLGDPALLELHVARVPEGSEDGGWAPLPAGLGRDFGDGIAQRVAFGADGVAEVVLSDELASSTASVVGIVVRGEEWLHADGGDLRVPLRAPTVKSLVARLAAGEAAGSNLFDRFCRVNDALGEAAQAGAPGAAAVFATLRLSSIRQLPWYEGGNYQGKDMAHVQESLAGNVARLAVESEDGLSRQLFRAALATLPRGGGNGDDIRLGILQIMRDNGIKEGHRPGIEDPFIAQWHQKLHSNTTADDVSICEAYLHFLHTGNWDDFWAHLWDNAGLTREDLAGMKAGWRTSGITGPALHMPHLIGAFQHFHWILRTTHAGGNLDSARDFARGQLPDDLQWEVDDLLDNRDAWWVPGKVVEVRHKLRGTLEHNPARDTVMLDAQLEKFFRTKVEAVDAGALSPDDQASLLELALRNAAVGVGSARLDASLGFLHKALHASPYERWGSDWALALDAALDAVALAMEHEMDAVCALVQPCAEALGAAAGSDQQYITNFGEEVVRSHSLFVVSMLLSTLQPHVRHVAGLSPWSLASTGGAPLGAYAGTVAVTALADLQGADLSATPTVVLSERLGGLEDVPPGVTAVICASPVDLLSHIAIRARNTGVLLASVADAAQWAALAAMEGEGVRLTLAGEEVVMERAEAPGGAGSAAGAGASAQALTLRAPEASSAWVVPPSAYGPGVVGGKAASLAALGARVGELGVEGVRVPASAALPFGSFERALEADAGGAEAFRCAVEALGEAEGAEARRAALAGVRAAVEGLAAPQGALDALAGAADELTGGGGAGGGELYAAVKRVWASKWTERAFLSRESLGVPDADLHMATLLMELVDASHAFVLHSANPLTGKAEVFGEVCVGLGESLVSNDPGRAFSFTCGKDGSGLETRSLPSKLLQHRAPAGGTVIARSDSNGEDLEGFAGAGLYESVTAAPTEEAVVQYEDEWLVWDTGRREALARRLAGLAAAVEDAMGCAQDIEGAICGDDIVLLQSRAQV